MNKVEEFIHLQNLINNQIDEDGEASENIVNRLEELSKSLTEKDEDEIILYYRNNNI